MRINTHVASGIILALLLKLSIIPNLSLFEILFIIFSAMVMDFDFPLAKWVKDHNHRLLPTHGYFPYLILFIIGLTLGIFFSFIQYNWFLFLGLAGMIHVSLDLIDWGTAGLTPFKRERIYGGILEIPRTEGDEFIPQCYFATTYYHSKIILGVEAIIFSIMVVFIFIVDLIFLFLLLIYGFFLGFHLFHYIYCRTKEKSTK